VHDFVHLPSGNKPDHTVKPCQLVHFAVCFNDIYFPIANNHNMNHPHTKNEAGLTSRTKANDLHFYTIHKLMDKSAYNL
jgi:hypothetical protein